MLKALELVGFKSFAEKTRFDFPEGITVIVGPNGSGKSNIVDAIKWVLGEQSAKSLRGQEMSDVIFKGSGEGSRRPMNTAEATLVFDNSTAQLEVDATEVHVTRRVYRSGEGEYLINGQPSRLRDIRNLFRGTGAGADAYSLIEQGKVDVLLAASPQQRRAIFEEAAGISRFKAKKIECSRRLERVDLNLVRLADIAEEVDSRLRGVKSQAGKARRYKEYTERLQQLRTQVSHVDWHDLTLRLQESETEAEEFRENSLAMAGQAESLETEALQIEGQLEIIRNSIRTEEALAADTRERIASGLSTVELEQRRTQELDEAISINRQHLARMSAKAGDLARQLQETQALVTAAESEFGLVQDRVRQADEQMSAQTKQIDSIHESIELQREQHRQLLNEIASLSKNLTTAESRYATVVSTVNQCHKRLEHLRPLREKNIRTIEEISSNLKELREQQIASQTLVENTLKNLSSHRKDLHVEQQNSLRLQGEITVCTERANVLQELEQRLEGVNAGVKEVLQRAREATSGPFADVVGLVADLLQVNVETAPMVEVALGDLAHYVVLQGHSLLDQLRTGGLRIRGRVGFLRADEPEWEKEPPDAQLGGHPGVLGRADQFVASSGPLAGLIQRLLGNTWFVEDIDQAIRLLEQSPTRCRLVTRAGELIESDGSIVVGSQQTHSGIISRRSELRVLRESLISLQQELQQVETNKTRLETFVRDGNTHQHEQEQQLKELTHIIDEHQLRLDSNGQQLTQIETEYTTLAAEEKTVLKQRDSAKQAVAELQTSREQSESQLTELEQSLHRAERELTDRENTRQTCSQELTEAKIELAKREQVLESHHAAFEQYKSEQLDRERTLHQLQNQTEADQKRCLGAERNILTATTGLATIYLAKEAHVAKVDHLSAQREQLGQQRSDMAQRAKQMRQNVRDLEQKLHQAELEVDRIRHERTNLEVRLREEYDIEISKLQEAPSDQDERQRTEIDGEILELRRKINNIGAVNMHAIAELDDLESRHQSLEQQYNDLQAAKNALEQIVRKINTDSRRLFTETLDAIRANFQLLFRKTFGGGRADIVLEEGVDILESGIDLVATPPGKNSLGLSLLSGGERALTAVTLLLAIFQCRPSPFCVLDEVDGPLDEANIERFTGVLNDFLHSTRFVVVTHSKKTMTAATTLYGVTMQESGVSKRVSVRFDDVAEDGQISQPAMTATDDSDGDGNERGAA